MLRINTTISKDYVSNWGMKEGVREIMQNAMDANDQGHKMGVSYIRGKRQLLIYNRGTDLKRENLLLGSTTKFNDKNMRGQYGEGFKVGALALVRDGKPVSIYNGPSKEKWECVIGLNKEFNSRVLAFNIVRNKPKDINKLLFTIDNISPKEWKSMNTMFLDVYAPDPKSVLKTPQGEVLQDKDLKGRIYCGGIYVNTDDELGYGYNFLPSVMPLNRDRNLVNSFDLKWNTSKMWAYLSSNSKGKLYDAKSMLKQNLPDVKFMKEFSDYTVTGEIVKDFFKENSEKAYPVTSNEEARSVRNMGYSPVYSSDYYAGSLREDLGTIEDLKRTVELDYTLFQKIKPTDDANIQWVFEVLYKVNPKFTFEIVVAQFQIETTRSVLDKKKLVINCNLLSSKYEILHEAVMFYCMETRNKDSLIWKTILKNTIEGME